ncbi:glutamate racemase [Fontibacillus sp. BL9]|uniref:glutamate racemase n=1 Tax=Fontibacillus sp. BL9 TaxID=3389971 RepID=UPI00397BE0AD
MRIGFFDSGIGGLTVLHQALRFMPKEDFLFYADTLHVPYGEKTKEEVREYVINAVDFIANQNVKALFVACNTATSIVIEELREKYNFPILGMEPAVKPAIEKCAGKQKRVLVLATALTLKEKKYLDLIQKNLSPLDLSQYGTLVLGCTHFPYFEGSLKRIFPKDVNFVSGSIGTAKNLKRILESNEQCNQGTGDIVFYKSGIEVEDTFTLSRYQSLFQILDELMRQRKKKQGDQVEDEHSFEHRNMPNL